MTLNILALFCEDIREEMGGVLSLIGVIPDNVNVSNLPNEASSIPPKIDIGAKVLSKLCVFVRINFDPEYELPEGKLRLVLPNDEKIELGNIDSATIKKAQREAKEKGNPLAGVISRAVLGGFRIPKLGVLKLEAVFGGEVHIAGAINFQSMSPSST